MEEIVMLNVQNGGYSKLIIADKDATYDGILDQTVQEWKSLNGRELWFTFDVGTVKNCVLKTQQDLNNLLVLCKLKGEMFVQVQVAGKDNGGEIAVKSPSPKSHFQSPTNISNEQHFGDDEIDDGIFAAGRGLAKKGLGTPMDTGKLGSGTQFTMPTYDVSPHLKPKSLLTDSWRGCIHSEGQIFKGGAAEFRDELIKFTEKNGTAFDYVRNDKDYIYAVCREKVDRSCEWFVRGKRIKVNNMFVIYKLNLCHKCVGSTTAKFKSRLSAAILGREFEERIRQDPTAMGRDIKTVLMSSYGVDVTYSRAWRGREAARGEIFGTFKKSFNELKWYGKAVEKTNKGSIVSIHHNSETKAFEKMFVAFNALIEGFKSCRPMLFIDGAHLSGRLKGCILTATAKDANNGLFPIAFAVVSSETLDNWKWFLENLRDGIKHDKEILYVSDRNTGLMSAFPKVFEKPLHFFCLVHLYTNLKTMYGGRGYGPRGKTMVEYLKEAAYAPTKEIFHAKLDEFKLHGGPRAEEWLVNLPYDKWAVSYSIHIMRYGEMTSNTAESFNNWILEARSLPVCYMIDCIRMGLMRWFVERRKEVESWNGALSKQKEDTWYVLTQMGISWNVVECPEGELLVISDPSVVVNLEKKTCSCYQWQITGFPCAHAVAAIRRTNHSMVDMVDPFFHASMYKKTYSSPFYPIPKTEKYECLLLVDDEEILPPANAAKVGRPAGKRKKASFEKAAKRKKTICPLCGQLTKHDKFTCIMALNKAAAPTYP